MTTHNLEKWRRPRYLHQDNVENERNTKRVVALTLIMMAIEIIAGSMFGSMALLADGWHMGTHAAALGITLAAYYYARRYAQDRRFAFGTGKMGVLGGFTSAVVLLLVALLMGYEAVQRLFSPLEIRFNEAILVAVVGLTVNLTSAFLLQGGHGHSHEHGNDHGHSQHAHSHNDSGQRAREARGARENGHGHAHSEPGEDHNLRAAYLHVLADALTSVLAIAALLAGKYFGWSWLDPVIGMVGALVIMRWSIGLLTDTGSILLDESAEDRLIDEMRRTIEADADNQVVDLFAWKISSNQYAASISILTHEPRPVEHYRKLLKPIDELAHLTIEINVCTEQPCLARRKGRMEVGT